MNQPSQQALRQIARRKTREVVERRRHERLEKERRIVAHAETVMIAIAERDLAIEVAEARAGAALRELFETEGLSVREAVEWCGGSVDTREATRLRRRTCDSTGARSDSSAESSTRDAGVTPVTPGAPPAAPTVDASTPVQCGAVVDEAMGVSAR